MRENAILILMQLEHPDPEVQSRATVMLRQMGSEGLEALISYIFSGKRDAYKHIPHLREFKKDALSVLRKLLYSETLLLADAAIRVLLEYGEEGVVILLEAVDQTSLLTQMNIVKALGETGDKSAVDSLRRLLRNCETPSVRYTIMDALIELDDASAFEDIISYEDDPNHHVRERVEIARERLKARKNDG